MMIGLFDSGVGGLTVLKQVVKKLPNDSTIYFGDTLRIPYGLKSAETVIEYSNQVIRFLISKGAEVIIIACNTATVIALKSAQQNFEIPIIGVIEAGAQGAVKATHNNKVGVIGTVLTIESLAHKNRIRELKPSIKVIGVPCLLFTPIVEAGEEDSERALEATKEYFIDLVKEEIDTLVLGCTHFPVMSKTIRKVLGDDIELVNPAVGTVDSLIEVINKSDILFKNQGNTSRRFYVSGDPEKFRIVGSKILGMRILNVEKIDIAKY